MADITAAQRVPARSRLWRIPPELALAAVGLAAAWAFPDDLGFIARINILTIFALSLALVIGQAGIGTLGQAALFGAGSYSAALWALHITSEPLSGLLVGAIAGAGIGRRKRAADPAHKRPHPHHAVGGLRAGAV